MDDASNGSENAEAVKIAETGEIVQDQEFENPAQEDWAAAQAAKAEMELQMAAQSALLDEVIKDRDAALAERDAALAKLAKMDAAPKARSGVAKARKVGPVKDQLSPSELLELIGAANVVELAFSDGKKELSIPARQISGRAWIVNAVGLKLQLPEFIVEGPDGGAQSLAGYGLFLDGEQVAWAPRPDVMEVVPRRKSDLRHDVVFTGN